MKEIRRLVESSPHALTRELLDSGLEDAPSPQAAPRIAAALGLAAGVTGAGLPVLAASTGAALGGSSPLGALALVKWLGAGLLAGTVASGGAVVVHRKALSSDVSPPPASASAISATPVAPAGPSPAGPRAEAAARAVAPGLPPAEVPGASIAQRQPPAGELAVGRLPDETSALAHEVARIDQARVSLRRGEALAALAALDRYDEERQTRVLDREAAVLRIEALVLAGRRDEARQRAQRYLDRYPADAHTAGLRELVRGVGPAQGIDR